MSNAVQLFEAIGPNRLIRLMPGDYEISLLPTNKTSACCHWLPVFDGVELVVSNVTGLRLVGIGPQRPSLLARPAYANVLAFRDCREVSLDHLHLEHRVERGFCQGSVTAFTRSRQVSLVDCDLAGSGTEGVILSEVQEFTMTNSIIRDCSQSILTVFDSAKLRFLKSTFRENGNTDLLRLVSSTNLVIEDCLFERNHAEVESYWTPSFFHIEDCREMSAVNCRFIANSAAFLVNRPDRIRMERCSFSKNKWLRGKYGPPESWPDPEVP